MIFLGALCWGSCLNVIAYSWLHGYTWIARRSFCPSCSHTLAWYDLIPLASWLLLQRKCRHCKVPISWLYPLIEFITALSFTLAWLLLPIKYIPAYWAFFSGLIITLRTDLESYLVFRPATTKLLPIAFLTSAFGYLPLSLIESTLGAVIGYGLLWIVRTLFLRLTGREGLGEGDLDILSMVGGFTGITGVWITLTLSSVLGLLATGLYLLFHGKPTAESLKKLHIPFGPFLALGAIAYVLWDKSLTWYILYL